MARENRKRRPLSTALLTPSSLHPDSDSSLAFETPECYYPNIFCRRRGRRDAGQPAEFQGKGILNYYKPSERQSLRIIAGTHRGRTLRSVKGMATRPTSDRVRESVFNILSFRIRDAVVSDLFAGTGAMGIEALSRGAEFAVFVDQNKEAVSVIHKNLEDCGFGQKARVIRWDITRNLNCLKVFDKKFDLVFIDPPYHNDLIRPALKHLIETDCLAASACIVIEHDSDESIPEDMSEFCLADQRKYGRTCVSFLNMNYF